MQALEHCICCGAPVHRSAEIQWHPKTRILTGRGHAIAFGIVRAKIFDLFWSTIGKRPHTRVQILDYLYGGDPNGGPEFADESASRLIRKLREDIEPFGLVIDVLSRADTIYVMRDVGAASSQKSDTRGKPVAAHVGN